MWIFKGDKLRTTSGMIGEVTDTWGVAHTFYQIVLDSGRSLPIMHKDVAEIVKRKPVTTKRGRR